VERIRAGSEESGGVESGDGIKRIECQYGENKVNCKSRDTRPIRKMAMWLLQ